MIRKASISDCGKYRYELTREWDNTLPRVMFIMLNPSTADGKEDDPTVTRCINFAKDWGYGSLVICNIFAYRSADPNLLRKAGKSNGVEYIQGEYNNDYIEENAAAVDKVILGWGIRGSMLGDNDQKVIDLLRKLKIKMYYLELSLIWDMPCHPLMLKKTLTPKRYAPWKKEG